MRVQCFEVNFREKLFPSLPATVVGPELNEMGSRIGGENTNLFNLSLKRDTNTNTHTSCMIQLPWS